jgi:hypothetical protein
MIIDSTRQLTLTAQYEKTSSRSESVRLRAWQGEAGNGTTVAFAASSQTATRRMQSAERTLGEGGLGRAERVQNALASPGAGGDPAAAATAAGATAETAAAAPAATDDITRADPKLALVRLVVEMLTGRKVRVIRAADLGEGVAAAGAAPGSTAASASQPGRPAGPDWGAVLETTRQVEETEASRFTATGRVRTRDGRDIAFTLHLEMDSHFSSTTTQRSTFGNAAKDPLVIDFAGSGAQLLDQRFAFDLDGDGSAEAVPMLAAGSGYLAFDRNRNGHIDAGNELFGPQSGDGFGELATLDADGNGWIDEADPAFAGLGIWRLGGDGQMTLTGLKAAGIGALALAHLATPLDLRGAQQTLLGNLRASGIALDESGQVRPLQRIDLVAA